MDERYAVLLLDRLIRSDGVEEFDYDQVFWAVSTLSYVLFNKEIEDLFVGLLNFDGPVHWSPYAVLPDDPPLEVLKAMVVKTLGRETGGTYLGEIKHAQTKAMSPLLLGVILSIIKEIIMGIFTKKRDRRERTDQPD